MTQNKINITKIFLLSAGIFASFAKISFAEIVPADTAADYFGDSAEWVAESHDIGLLLGFSEDDYDDKAGAFVDGAGCNYAFYPVFWESGSEDSAEIFENYGSVTFHGSELSDAHKAADCVIISGNAAFANYGAAAFAPTPNSGAAPALVIANSATFDNAATGAISGLDKILFAGNSTSPNYGTFANYGEIAATNLTVSVFTGGSDNYVSAPDFAGKAYFKNYGVIDAESVSIDSFVEITLVQGSQITGNLEIGDKSTRWVNGEDYFHYADVVAPTTILNIVMSGDDAETPLVAGNITLYNTTNLVIDAAPDSKLEKYSLRLWDGDNAELLTVRQSLYEWDDNKYHKKFGSSQGALLAASGKFKRSSDGRTFDWNLDTGSGTLFAELAETKTVRDYKLSTGSKTISATEGDTFYITTSKNFCAKSGELGALLGLDEENFNAKENAFLTFSATWESARTDDDGKTHNYANTYNEYDAFNSLFFISETAKFTNKGTIIFRNNEKNFASEISYDNEEYTFTRDDYYYHDMVVISGEAKFVNEGWVDFEAAVPVEDDDESDLAGDEGADDFAGDDSGYEPEPQNEYSGVPTLIVADSATFKNAESGTVHVENIIMLGSAGFENAGTLGGEFYGYSLELVATEDTNFVNSGTIEIADSIELYDNATFDNSGVLDNKGGDSDFYLQLSDNAAFTNSGVIGAETGDKSLREIWLSGNTAFANKSSGKIYGGNIRAFLSGNASFASAGAISLGGDMRAVFDFFEDGNAVVANSGDLSAGGNIGIYWLQYAEIDDEAISKKFTGIFTNSGSIVAESIDLVLATNIDVAVANAKNYQNLSTTGRISFVNAGTITADTISVDSHVETTLRQSSQIDGNLVLGKASAYSFALRDDDGETAFYSHGTTVANKTILNIVLDEVATNAPMITGNLTLFSDTELNVSVSGASTTKLYAVQLWAGKFVAGEQTVEVENSNDSEGKIATTIGNFVEKNGKFTRASDGKAFSWELDTGSGLLVAISQDVNEHVKITQEAQEKEISAADVGSFDPALVAFSGKISGAGEVHSWNQLSFAGNAENYSGTTFIDAGTFEITEAAKLGAGAYEIADIATLEISGNRDLANATRGEGTLFVASGATVSFEKAVGTKTLNVAENATLLGGATLSHNNATLLLAGALDLAAGESVAFTNGGEIVLAATAKLNIDPDSGEQFTIFSGATISADSEISTEQFLITDEYIADMAQEYAVVYSADNGLGVTIVESIPELLSEVRLHDGLGTDFIAALIGESGLGLEPGIKSASDLDPLVNAILNHSGDVGAAMTTLSPLSYAAMVAMPSTAFHNDVRLIESRLATQREKPEEVTTHWASGETAEWGFFAQAQSTFLNNDNAKDSPVFDFETYGVLVGADCQIGSSFMAGVSLAYDNGKAKIHDGGGKIESDDFRLTLYAGEMIGDLVFVNAGLQFGYGSYSARRKTILGNANGDTNVWNGGAFVDVGMLLTLSEDIGISLRPYVGIAYVRSQVESFSDNIFAIDSFSGDSMRTRVGVGIFWDFELAQTNWSIGVDGSYSHDFFGDEVDIDARYRGDNGGSFRATAKAMSSDVFSVGPVVNIGITRNIGIFAGYTFDAGTNSAFAHSANVGVRINF